VSDRTHSLTELSSRVFDLLVVGGGITGAGIARDASLRGLSVALIDKGDFGSGTSSRSSRLIHGGVRYLEHGQLKLVFEASGERRKLGEIASHLVLPLRFTWPVYRGQRMGVWKLNAGLALYDALSLYRNYGGNHRKLSASGILEDEPALRRDDLLGGAEYFDATTDDARLTLVNVLDARELGAVVVNHVAFTSAAPDTERVRVVRLEDALSGTRLEARARVVVNATGPWSDTVERMQGGGTVAAVQGSKGAHIAVPRARVGNRGAVVLLHPRDGRVMFALPADSHAIIGTTDTFTDISPDEVRANEADVAYLLEAANAFFPHARLTRADVVAAWAGIRPLMPTTGSSVAASREHLIRTTDHGVRITGGKLTTFRVMASQVVTAAQRLIGLSVHRARTDLRALPGGDVYAHQLNVVGHPDTKPDSFEAHAIRAYGSLIGIVQELCERGAGAEYVVAGLPYRMGEMQHAVAHEMACTLGDLLVRRTKIAFETPDNGRAAARRVAAYLAPSLNWDATLVARELTRYDAEVTRIFGIDP